MPVDGSLRQDSSSIMIMPKSGVSFKFIHKGYSKEEPAVGNFHFLRAQILGVQKSVGSKNHRVPYPSLGIQDSNHGLLLLVNKNERAFCNGVCYDHTIHLCHFLFVCKILNRDFPFVKWAVLRHGGSFLKSWAGPTLPQNSVPYQ